MGAAAALVAVVAIAIVVTSGSSHSRPGPALKGAANLIHSGTASAPEREGLSAVRRVLAYTPFVQEGGTKGHDIALTFDDGPGPYTPELLKVLEHYGVQATFFAIGRMVWNVLPCGRAMYSVHRIGRCRASSDTTRCSNCSGFS